MSTRTLALAAFLALPACTNVQTDVQNLCAAAEATLASAEYQNAPPDQREFIVADNLGQSISTSAVVDLVGILANTPPPLRPQVIANFEAEQGVTWNCPAWDEIFAAPAPPAAAAPAAEAPAAEAPAAEAPAADAPAAEAPAQEAPAAEAPVAEPPAGGVAIPAAEAAPDPGPIGEPSE